MNKVILMGNLTRDPEIRYSRNDNSLVIARFSIAVNRRFARQGETDVDFFNCTAFGKQAEFVEKYFKQGSRMLLTGRIQNDNYTNNSGEKVYSVQIITEEIEFAERKSHADNHGSADVFSQAPQEPVKPNAPTDVDEDFLNIPDGVKDNLPFS